ncbi:DUF2252 family protein [Guptibacillus hwajinpoensis]|uniref:DUF2252 family protein n=1 Tax=Guptibacillus hwajinpoensis TaxID=208199 RepID=UPI0034E58445
MIIDQFDSTLMQLTKAERKTKYSKMSESPFSFFRGSAYLYYYDVTQIPFHYHTQDDKPTWLDEIDESLRHYEMKDIVEKKEAGIGSTGLKRYLILVHGESAEDHLTDLILEIKEACTPIPAYFFPYEQAFWDTNKHEGLRVIKAQQAMHHKQDPHLGYVTISDKEFYVREKSPYTKETEPKHIKEYKDLKQTVKTMGQISAKIHARADTDIDHHYLTYHSETEIFRVIDDWKNLRYEVNEWATFYQKRVKKDYDIFIEWCKQKNYI